MPNLARSTRVIDDQTYPAYVQAPKRKTQTQCDQERRVVLEYRAAFAARNRPKRSIWDEIRTLAVWYPYCAAEIERRPIRLHEALFWLSAGFLGGLAVMWGAG